MLSFVFHFNNSHSTIPIELQKVVKAPNFSLKAIDGYVYTQDLQQYSPKAVFAKLEESFIEFLKTFATDSTLARFSEEDFDIILDTFLDGYIDNFKFESIGTIKLLPRFRGGAWRYKDAVRYFVGGENTQVNFTRCSISTKSGFLFSRPPGTRHKSKDLIGVHLLEYEAAVLYLLDYGLGQTSWHFSRTISQTGKFSKVLLDSAFMSRFSPNKPLRDAFKKEMVHHPSTFEIVDNLKEYLTESIIEKPAEVKTIKNMLEWCSTLKEEVAAHIRIVQGLGERTIVR